MRGRPVDAQSGVACLEVLLARVGLQRRRGARLRGTDDTASRDDHGLLGLRVEP